MEKLTFLFFSSRTHTPWSGISSPLTINRKQTIVLGNPLSTYDYVCHKERRKNKQMFTLPLAVTVSIINWLHDQSPSTSAHKFACLPPSLRKSSSPNYTQTPPIVLGRSRAASPTENHPHRKCFRRRFTRNWTNNSVQVGFTIQFNSLSETETTFAFVRLGMRSEQPVRSSLAIITRSASYYNRKFTTIIRGNCRVRLQSHSPLPYSHLTASSTFTK